MTTTTNNYDWSFNNETIHETYTYGGFNIKIASIEDKQYGRLFYGIADHGDPMLCEPGLFHEIQDAKENIEEFIRETADFEEPTREIKPTITIECRR